MSWDYDGSLEASHMVVDPRVLAQLCLHAGRRSHRAAGIGRELDFPRWSLADRDRPSAN